MYGLDTEFVAERTYWPRLCLVQLAWPGGMALIDPLACDVGAFVSLLDSHATMVTHAGAADLPILERACGARPAHLFDTQLAAGFVGMGTPSLVTLVSTVLGTRLDKSQQLTDWARRPLSEAARRYAAGDVAYLLPVVEDLRRQLAESDRQEWVIDECEALRTAPLREQDPDLAWWRVKGRVRCAASPRSLRSRLRRGASAGPRSSTALHVWCCRTLCSQESSPARRSPPTI